MAPSNWTGLDPDVKEADHPRRLCSSSRTPWPADPALDRPYRFD
ncbi:hypothetical protein ACRAWD_03580 [Caulobacter segnis]